MFFRYKKPLQAAAFFLVICLANGYVLAAIPGENAIMDTAHPETPFSGVLNAFDASSIRVNGNAAQDGMTVLSGAEIKTGVNGGATINLRRLGKVELSSETTVKLVFAAEQVDLQVLSGQAELTTFKGINGLLTDAEGKSLMTDATIEISSVGNAETAAAASPGVSVASPGLFGMGFLGTAAAIGGVVSGSVLVWVGATKPGNSSRGPVSRVQP